MAAEELPDLEPGALLREVPSFAAVRERLRRELTAKRGEAARQQLARERRRRYRIEGVDDTGLPTYSTGT